MRGVQLGFVALALIAWHLSTANGIISPFLLPPPRGVFEAMLELVVDSQFWRELATTAFELAVAFAVAAVSGLTIGYFVSRTRFRVRVFDPLLSSLY